jgi:hypothetical protein
LNDIKRLFDNPTANANEIRSLEGKIVFMNRHGVDGVYEHTVVLGAYDPVTGTIEVFESNGPVNRSPGVYARKLNLKRLVKSWEKYDIYEFSNN